MFNLFDIMRGAQGGAAMGNISRQFGLTPAQTQMAVEALLPAFAMGLQRNAMNPNAMGPLFGMLGSGQHAGFFDNPAQGFSPQVQAQGNTVLGQLFGSPDVSRQVAAQAATLTGVGTEILKQMLPFVAAMLIGGLFRAASNQGVAGIFGQITDLLRAGQPSGQAAGGFGPGGFNPGGFNPGGFNPGGFNPGAAGPGGPFGMPFGAPMGGASGGPASGPANGPGNPAGGSPGGPFGGGPGGPLGDLLAAIFGGLSQGGHPGPYGNPGGSLAGGSLPGGSLAGGNRPAAYPGGPGPTPDPAPPASPPNPAELWSHVFQTGREVQQQHLNNLQTIFDTVWGAGRLPR